MNAIKCPTAEEWRQFALGRVSVQDGDRLGSHLDECNACVSTIQALRDEDTLTEAIRVHQENGESVETELVAEVALRLRFRSIPAAEQSTIEGGSSPPKSADTQDFPAEGPKTKIGNTNSEGFDIPERLGHYRILRMLGHGGMGVVLEAEDTQLKRTVALKVMKSTTAAREGSRERFLREAQAAAGIEHENIITIFHVGEDKGVAFAAMPLLQGESLEHRLEREQRLSVDDALRIAREIASGLAAAHERHLIHRDIKPGNVWIEASTGRVKILDFGLARPILNSVGLAQPAFDKDAADDDGDATASGAVTRHGAIVGTPAYMAPEQAQAMPLDGRCDLFSLGCLLYRVCTGLLPFVGKDTVATLLAVNFQEPKPPRELNPSIPSEVEALVLKLLAKKPDDRFRSATEVVERIRTVERSIFRRKLLRRLSVPLAASLLLLVVGVTYFYGSAMVRMAMNRGAVTLQSDDPDVEVVVKQAEETVALFNRNAGTKVELLAGEYRVELATKTGEWALVPDRFRLERNGTIVLKLRRIVPTEVSFQRDDLPMRIALKRDGKLVRTVEVDKTVKETLLPGRYDLELLEGPGRLRLTPPAITVHEGEALQVPLRAIGEWRQFDGHGGAVWSVASAKNTVLTGSEDRTLSVWNLDTGAEVRRWKTKKPVQCVALSPDASFALSAAGKDPNPDFNLYLWDLSQESPVSLQGHASPVATVALSPDGTKAASGSMEGALIVWDVKKRQIDRRLAGHADSIHSVAISPLGHQVASAADDGIRAWDVFTGQEVLTLAGKAESIRCVAFSPDGNRVASGGYDNIVRIWDLASKKEIHRFVGHSGWVTSVAFSPDGKRVVSASADKTVRVWEIATGVAQVVLDGHTAAVQSVAFAGEGRLVLSASVDKSVRLWRLP